MDSARWHTLTLAAQMGNIGSEISRIQSWKERGNPSVAESAIIRACDLLNATITDTRWTARLHELVRFREVFLDAVFDTHAYDVPLEQLQTYCSAFAHVARQS